MDRSLVLALNSAYTGMVGSVDADPTLRVIRLTDCMDYNTMPMIPSWAIKLDSMGVFECYFKYKATVFYNNHNPSKEF